MRDDADSTMVLEQRIIAAHRAYIDALAALERARHRLTCSACCAATRDRGGRSGDTFEEARTRKEACRVEFRNLVDALGYLPQGLSARLPNEGEDSCIVHRAARADDDCVRIGFEKR